MKRITIVLFTAFSILWACDIYPAEEKIANTGAASFSASFECPSGVNAYWEDDDKVVVIDSKNMAHRFDLDNGASKIAAEFSGTLSENSKIKYVAYSHDPNVVAYNSDNGIFTMEVPSVYTAKSADALVKTNQVAIGTLQGSEVALKPICGFIKFSLEPNGKTLEQGGRTYNLTDLRQITFTDNDDKAFAGTVQAKWDDGSAAPSYVGVENGESTIVFRTRQLSTPDGDIFYEAGDYYIPVLPQNYENVTIIVEDADGNTATAVANRAIDVQTAMQSNLNNIQWPTIVIEVNLECQSVAEESTHVELATLSTHGLSVDRVNNTTGEKASGACPKKTEITFTEGGQQYSLWTDSGVGRYTANAVIGGGRCMADLCFGYYNANWSYEGQSWAAGNQKSTSWIKFPVYDGVLTKVEIHLYYSAYNGAMSISTEVDQDSGIGNHQVYYTPKLQGNNGSFGWESISVTGAKRGDQYYLCLEDGHTWRIRGWRLHYKSYK